MPNLSSVLNLTNTFLLLLTIFISTASGFERHPVPTEHPRLLGSAERLKQLAVKRPEAYARTGVPYRDFACNVQNRGIFSACAQRNRLDSKPCGPGHGRGG